MLKALVVVILLGLTPLMASSQQEAPQKPVAQEDAKVGERRARLAVLKLLGDYVAPVSLGRPTEGIELEGVFPGKVRAEAFEGLEKIMREKAGPAMFPGRPMSVERFEFKTRGGEPREGLRFTFTLVDGQKSVWELKDDGSIKPPKDHIGVEIVSPILPTLPDQNRFKTLVTELVKEGFKPEPGSAALQMHGGFSETGKVATDKITDKKLVSQALLLILLWSKIEVGVMEHYGVNPARQHFTRPSPESLAREIEGGKINTANINLHDFLMRHYEVPEQKHRFRYLALNVMALFQFGTIEVRFMNSTVDLSYIDALDELIHLLVNGIKSKDPKIVSLLLEYAGKGDIPVDVTIKRLGLKHLQPSEDALAARRAFKIQRCKAGMGQKKGA